MTFQNRYKISKSKTRGLFVYDKKSKKRISAKEYQRRQNISLTKTKQRATKIIKTEFISKPYGLARRGAITGFTNTINSNIVLSSFDAVMGNIPERLDNLYAQIQKEFLKATSGYRKEYSTYIKILAEIYNENDKTVYPMFFTSSMWELREARNLYNETIGEQVQEYFDRVAQKLNDGYSNLIIYERQYAVRI